MGWNLLSYGKACSASSELEGHEAVLAGDENVRTWWSAASGEAGEWFGMDLGRPMRIEAVQLNFAEQDVDTTRMAEDYTAYRLLASLDGEHWETVVDESRNRTPNPHRFVDFKRSITARYLRAVNVKAMLQGKFAIRDLRVFGHGLAEAPARVERVVARRNREDERFAHVEWMPSAGAEGYLVCFGYAPDHLNLTVQVKGDEKHDLVLHILTKGQPYWYRVDAYNDSGVTVGETVAEE